MKRTVGVSAFGLRALMIKSSDNIVDFVVNTILSSNIALSNRDIIGITESLVARAQKNIVSLEDIGKDILSKYPSKEIGLVFPITSRNRFALILQAIANVMDKVYVQFSLPSDEVGNPIISREKFITSGLSNDDILSTDEFYEKFGHDNLHPFTKKDYVKLYKEMAPNIEIIFSNNPLSMLKYTKNVLVCDIHTRDATKRILEGGNPDIIYGLEDIMTEPIGNSGYNSEYGLLGSNMSTDSTLKLFPRDCVNIVHEIQDRLKLETGKTVEVLVYGDGGFKDPLGGIWELADPVVSPGYTSGLEGSPDEVKLKYIVDTENVSEEDDVKKALLRHKKKASSSLGTTPRRYRDLIGSLCDLMSGSGDKGTPIVLVKGYTDSYIDD